MAPADPTTWTKEVVFLQKNFGRGPFAHVLTQRVAQAIDQLAGKDRRRRHNRFGWWPIPFPGFAAPPWHISHNTGKSVRFACNPRFPLRAEMSLRREDGNYSAVERAIRRALSVGG